MPDAEADIFLDLGNPREGLELVRELVRRDWSGLDDDRQQDLIQGGYAELIMLRRSFRGGSFAPYARTYLGERLCGLAEQVRWPEEDGPLDEAEPHGAIPERMVATRRAC